MSVAASLYSAFGLEWTCAVLGLLVGSFLNVVIARLPVMMERAWTAECAEWMQQPVAPQEPFNLATPRSRCPHCATPIRAWQNLPLLSFLLLRGRCAGCAQPISLRYPFVELLSAVMAAGIAATFGPTAQMLAALLLGWSLIALTFIDLDTQYLPDDLTLPLVWAGLLLAASGIGFTTLDAAVWGAAAGYLLLWSVYWAFRLLTGKEGMGAGDFKLLAALGAWLGWQALPGILLTSSLGGALCGVLAIVLRGQSRATPIPFGPFLALAGFVVLLVPGGLSLDRLLR